MVFNTGPYTVLPDNSILNTADMQSETGFPSSHQLKSYLASKSCLKLAARAVLSADAGLLVNTSDFYDLLQQLPPPILITGDFNSHSTLWGCTKLNRRGKMVEDILHCAKFRRNRSNHCRDMAIFQDGGRTPSWICGVHVWTTHESPLMVFTAVQNLVGIGVVFL